MPASFRPPAAFASPDGNYRLLPFRFLRLDDQYVLVNEAGEHHLLPPTTFERFVDRTLPVESPDLADLLAKQFAYSGSNPTLPVTLLATKYRTKKSFLAGFTRLHIFVVTLRCDHSCHYCQVSRANVDRSKYDMSVDSADRALDVVFRSPSPYIKIEFQGGEPLLNPELIEFIIEGARRRNERAHKELQFVVATNLSFLTDAVLEILCRHDVLISTSLDGPAFIHNANRPRPGGNAYEMTIAGIERARNVLGPTAVAALMTTSRLSLEHPEAIVDEYVAQRFHRIFLRPLSPYGFAARTRQRTGYEVQDFLTFYTRALSRIIEMNRAGYFLIECYAQLLLTKMLTPFATGYVDLQSPAGAGISVAVYNYDGDVYVSDEARMLAEMGDTAFRLGNLHHNTYEEMFGGELLRSLVGASCVESLPGCADCAFQTYCGADPVENYTTQGDIYGHRPTSTFCGRNMGVIKHLLRLYHGNDPFVKELFWSWVQGIPRSELIPALPG